MSEAARLAPRYPASWGIYISLALHGIGMVLLMSTSPTRQLTAPLVESISVELFTPQQLEATPDPILPIMTTPATLSPEIELTPAAPPMIQATTMLSAKLLADPRNRQAREGLKTLTDTYRQEQLCGIEAMEQIHQWRDDLQPEWIAAYATSDTQITNNILVADGAAFRSDSQWYNLKFKCEVTPDLTSIIAFEFWIGDLIPQRNWDTYNLSILD